MSTDDVHLTRKFYDRISNVYDALADANEHTARKKGLALLAVQRGESVLEIGFGTGHSLVALAEAWLLRIVPPTTDNLTQLTMGGYFSSGKLWALHLRPRYFDPVAWRAGLPPGVGALVEKLSSDSATVTLVNLNQVSPRELVVQAGGYREHQFTSVEVQGATRPLDTGAVTVRLEPGAGTKLVFMRLRTYLKSSSRARTRNPGSAPGQRRIYAEKTSV
jgi:hypothetical protein